MKRLWIIFAVIFMGGCLLRTYTVQKPRPKDEEYEKRRKYMRDDDEDKDNWADTQTITVVEFETGGHGPEKSEPKGSGAGVEDESGSLYEEIDTSDEYLDSSDYDEVDEYESDADSVGEEQEPQLYIIQKNDTLQKVSQKFYGTTKKYMFLYKQNSDVLKSPDAVRPGMTIKIPPLE
ncbi:MAG: LysM peptidoglycan-binding domain-containing protein [Candidatus Omnitrophota bacterium]